MYWILETRVKSLEDMDLVFGVEAAREKKLKRER